MTAPLSAPATVEDKRLRAREGLRRRLRSAASAVEIASGLVARRTAWRGCLVWFVGTPPRRPRIERVVVAGAADVLVLEGA